MKKVNNEMRCWKNYLCCIIRDLTHLEYRDLVKVNKVIKDLMQQKYEEFSDIIKPEVEK